MSWQSDKRCDELNRCFPVSSTSVARLSRLSQKTWWILMLFCLFVCFSIESRTRQQCRLWERNAPRQKRRCVLLGLLQPHPAYKVSFSSIVLLEKLSQLIIDGPKSLDKWKSQYHQHDALDFRSIELIRFPFFSQYEVIHLKIFLERMF